jgi:hypothetical protein
MSLLAIYLDFELWLLVLAINVVRFNSKIEVALAGFEQQDPHTDSPYCH